MPPKPRICLRRDLVAGVRRAARVVAPAPPRGCSEQQLGDRARRCRSAGPSARPSVLIPRSTSQASNGPATAPIAFWWKAQLLAELGVGGDQRAADDVGVAAEVLRRRVHDDVGAERRAAAAGTGEANVLSTTSSAPRVVRELGQRGDVGDAEQRVGRRLAPDDPGRRPRTPARTASRSSSGDRGVLQAPPREHPGDQPEGAAVGVVGDDDVVAGPAARCAAACPRRPARRRTRARARRPRARPAPPRSAVAGRVGRCGCTRSRRAARRRRPACRSRSGRSAPTTAPVRGSGSCPAWIARVLKPLMAPTLRQPVSCTRTIPVSVGMYAEPSGPR